LSFIFKRIFDEIFALFFVRKIVKRHQHFILFYNDERHYSDGDAVKWERNTSSIAFGAFWRKDEVL
jgi:hypothetical protein